MDGSLKKQLSAEEAEAEKRERFAVRASSILAFIECDEEQRPKLRDAIVQNTRSPMKYNSPKPDEILQEDKVVEKLALGIAAANTRIVKVETLFE